MASSQFIVKTAEGEIGPLSLSEVRQMAADGQLGSQDLIRRAHEEKWYRTSAVRGLGLGRADTAQSASSSAASAKRTVSVRTAALLSIGCVLLTVVIIAAFGWLNQGDQKQAVSQNRPLNEGNSTASINSSARRDPPATESLAWNEGGTLHRATMQDWRDASYHNRLATCADIVEANADELGIRVDSEKEWRRHAYALEVCINEVAVYGFDGSVAEYAATCMDLNF